MAASVLYGVLLHGYLGGSWYTLFHSYSLGMVFGLTAWFLFCASLLLSMRVRFLERRWGQDRLLRLHRHAAQAGLLAGCLHGVLKTAFFPEFIKAHYTGGLGFGLLLILSFFSTLIMSPTVPDRPVLLGRFRDRIRLVLRYSVMKRLHHGLPAAMAIIMIHVLFASATTESPFRMALVLSTGGPVIALWFYHLWLRPRRAVRGTVTQVTSISPLLLSVSFQLSRKLPFVPGQFGYFRIISPLTGREEHPFTLASSPQQERDEIIVRREGKWTNALALCPPGSELRCDGPYGTFTLDDNRPMLWIAGGVGITPFYARIRAMAPGTAPFPHPVTLLWSTITAQEMPFRGEFMEYAAQGQGFSFIPILTREGEGGRLTVAAITAAMNALEAPSGLPCSVWFCGSRSLRSTVDAACATAGVPRGCFHYEDFSV